MLADLLLQHCTLLDFVQRQRAQQLIAHACANVRGLRFNWCDLKRGPAAAAAAVVMAASSAAAEVMSMILAALEEGRRSCTCVESEMEG